MYKITVNKGNGNLNLIKPFQMLNKENRDKCFQQYVDNKPEPWYYINCGANENNVVVIWKDENKNFRFSTEDLSSLKQLRDHVFVQEVEIIFDIEVKKV